MHTHDQAIESAIAHLLSAKPRPEYWSGMAAKNCEIAIDELIAELRAVKHRLNLSLPAEVLELLIKGLPA